MPTLLVEGWRFLPHSYALVNMNQLAALRRLGGVDLYHGDLPYFDRRWQLRIGLLAPADEQAIRDIPMPPAELKPDAVLRIAVPYNYVPAPVGRTFVFGTAEFGVVMPMSIRNNATLADALKDSPAHIITPSTWSRDGFVRSGAAPDRVHIVPHGVDTSIHKPAKPEQRSAARRMLGIPDHMKVLLNIGAMTKNKGLDHLFHAFAEVARKRDDVMLLLKGIDSLYPSSTFLRDTASRMDPKTASMVMSRTRCLVETLTTQQMAGLYFAADAYVCPYLAEGFNLPALEAIACGIPVICTAGGPTDDFTTPDFALRIDCTRTPHEKSGGYTIVPDEAHLVQCIERAISDADFVARAREVGPAFVASGWTWDHVAKRLVQTMGL